MSDFKTHWIQNENVKAKIQALDEEAIHEVFSDYRERRKKIESLIHNRRERLSNVSLEERQSYFKEIKEVSEKFSTKAGELIGKLEEQTAG